MKFGIMAFSYGFFVQFGGLDLNHMTRVRLRIGIVSGGIYRDVYTVRHDLPQMVLY